MSNKLYIKRYTLNKILDICNKILDEPFMNNKYPLPKIDTIVLRFSPGSCYVVDCEKTMNTKVKYDDDKLVKLNYIVHSTEGNFYIKKVTFNNIYLSYQTEDSKQHIKLGRLLKALIPNIKDEEIEGVVSEWKRLYTVDTSIVKVTDDIKSVYDMCHKPNGDLGGSCMRNQGYKMKIYEDLGCKIAYIEEDDTLVARSLIWEVSNSLGELRTVYDRIFSSQENYKLTLQTYFKKNGITWVNDDDYHTVKNVRGNYYHDELPYVDNMSGLDSEYRLSNHSTYFGVLQNTDGTYNSDGGVEIGDTYSSVCECCGDSHHEDDMYYVSDYGNVCESCVDDFPWCEDIDGRAIIDDAWYCECENKYYYYNDYKMYLYDCDYFVHKDSYSGSSAIFCEDIGEYVSESADVYYCVDIDCYYHSNCDLYYLEETDEYYYDKDAYLEAQQELKD